MHPILITGATGNVGSATVKALIDKGLRVRAGVHSVIKGERLKHELVELVEIDFSRPETLEAAMTGVEKMFLITPFTENQPEMVCQLVNQAKRCGLSHIVRLSALGAEQEPGIQLGRWHREAELHVERSGIPFTHLRPNSFMQNFSTYQAGSICMDDTFYLPLGTGRISYIDARDVADVALTVLQDTQFHNQAFTLTGAEALSAEEVAHVLSQALGRVIKYVDMEPEQARQAMLGHQMPVWMVNAMLELHAIGKAGQAGAVEDSVEKLTGRKPRTFADFAAEHKPVWEKKPEVHA